MKLLFDQNLSYRLTELLKDILPYCMHVRQLGFQSSDDRTIWEYAKFNDYCIVSKDDDFHQMSFVLGHPPKVIWIKLGNCTTIEISTVIRRNAKVISEFVQDASASFLILTHQTLLRSV